MNEQHFDLHPFSAGVRESKDDRGQTLNGSITRQANTLMIRYDLRGDLSDILLAVPSDSPTRQHNLWKDTCFEFFLAVPQSARYWEFNLSPAGHWNVYRFEDYRQGMQEELAFKSLPFKVQTQTAPTDPEVLTGVSVEIALELTAIVPVNQALEVAITTVLKIKQGEVTYWALTHPGPEADFHRRDSFMLNV